MARKSDGSVIIDSRFDTSGLSKGVNDAKKKVFALSSSMNKLGTAIKNTFSASNTSDAGKGYNELQKDIAKTEAQLDRLIEKQIRFVETGGNIKSRAFEGMEYDIEMTRNKLAQLNEQLSQTSKNAPRQFSKMKKWVESLKKSFSSLDRTTKKSHYSILRMLGTSVLFSTVFRTLNLITQGFTDGLNNLVQYSDDANASMSELKSSLTQLKNSFATAFMPIITVATPAITSFMSLISKATSYVSAFFSALSGKSTYTKAIEVQEDYAASLDKTANSAKKAQKYLSGLDEIRTFTEPETGALSPENMFTEETISSPIMEFADKVGSVIEEIKTLIKNEDWEGLGEYISDGIVSALNFLNDKLASFDWDELGEDVGEFLSGVDWTSIIKSGLKLKINFWKTIADIWVNAFKTAPLETAVLTALAALKFTGAGSTVLGALAKTIATETGLSVASGLFALGATVYVVFKFAEDAKKWWENIQKYGWDAGRRMSADKASNPYRNGTASVQEDGSGWMNSWVENLKKWQEENRKAREEEREEFKKFADLMYERFSSVKEYFELLFSRKAWEESMSGMKDAFKTSSKNAANAAIEIFNRFIDYLNDKMHFEWEPIKILGKEVVPGGSAQLFTIPPIPMLATGAVIPPNAPFAAILGDQKHGTNIETPEALLRKVVREESGRGGGGQYQFNAHINRRVLFEEMIEEAKLQQTTTGRNPFDLRTT